jgi:hypothetical protein
MKFFALHLLLFASFTLSITLAAVADTITGKAIAVADRDAITALAAFGRSIPRRCFRRAVD